MKKPVRWFKFYPDTYLADPALRACSAGARGIAMDLRCLARISSEVGFVLIAGKHPDDRTLGRAINSDHRGIKGYITELVKNGVLARDARTFIYFPDIVQEEGEYERHKRNGRKGGNPLLLKPEKPARKKPPAPEAAVPAAVDGDDSQAPRSEARTSRSEASAKRMRARSQENNENMKLRLLGVIPGVKPESEAESETEKESARPREDERVSEDAAVPVAEVLPPIAGAPAVIAGTANVVQMVRPEAVVVTGNIVRDRSWDGRSPDQAPPSPNEWRVYESWCDMAALHGRWAAGPLTSEQLTNLRLRFREVGSVEALLGLIQKASHNALWLGEVGEGWMPGFEDFVSATKFRKLLKGQYDKHTRRRPVKSKQDELVQYLLNRQLGGDGLEDDEDQDDRRMFEGGRAR